jgi:hypothetical protein
MKRVPVLIPFLIAVSALFIGILIFTYVEVKKAHPQMLDEKGHLVRDS